MAKHLPVPRELEHLIEKRDERPDRRKSGAKRYSTAQDASPGAQPERRKGGDRRKSRKKKAE